MKKTEPGNYPPVENLLDLIYEHYTENNPVEKNTFAGKAAKAKEKELEEWLRELLEFKKPSLVAARACVLIFQAFQLFSSSVQFCGLSRLPCPCRPESHKRNTCVPALASCSLCRSILT